MSFKVLVNLTMLGRKKAQNGERGTKDELLNICFMALEYLWLVYGLINSNEVSRTDSSKNI